MAEQNVLSKHLNDLTESVNVDHKRRLYSFLAFHYLGIIVLTLISVLTFSLLVNWVSLITTCFTIAVLVNLVIFHFFKTLWRCSQFASAIIVIFSIVLVFHGGVENTALYWVYPFPVILFALLGRYLGFIANILLYIAICWMLFFPEYIIAIYSNAEKIRFLASLLLLNFFSYINEISRENSHIMMTNINVSKEQKANTDALTNLPNRRFVDSIFFPATKVNHANAFPMVIIMADVDHFKNLNDTYGHKIGDIVLAKLARVLELSVRTEDVVARVGGEEFLLLFAKTDYQTGLHIADKIKTNIENMSLDIEGKSYTISMSFGLSVAQKYAEIDKTIKRADDKMYQAKRNGRNCIC